MRTETIGDAIGCIQRQSTSTKDSGGCRRGSFPTAQEEFEEELVLPLARMEYGSVGQTYVLLATAPNSMATGKLATTLAFTVKEIDPSSGMSPVLLTSACLPVQPLTFIHCKAMCMPI